MNQTPSHFTSRFTSLLTLVGVAVGLGNVWRFPYMMGSYGGSAFLIVYLLFTLLFAFPALMAEMTLGRISRKGTINAFRLVTGNRYGSIIGIFLLVVVTVSGSYYAVVVANVIWTMLFSAFVGFNSNHELYQKFLAFEWLQYGLTLLLIIACLVVIYKGLVKGIEWISRIIMPFFVIVLLYITFYAFRLPNAVSEFKLFLQPDLSRLGPPEIFAALGQAFFSVGLGGTFVVVYAGYLKDNENIPKMAFLTGLGDLGASVLVSLFLIPSILVFGLDMNSGPGLIFYTLPKLFAVMPGGRMVGSLFLITLSMVAFLSLIAAYQVPYVSVRNERPETNPKIILVVIGIVQALLALPSSLYPEIIGYLDLIFGSGMQVFGSLMCVLGLTWGLRKKNLQQDMFLDRYNIKTRHLVILWIKWVIPSILFIVLIGYLIESFG